MKTSLHMHANRPKHNFFLHLGEELLSVMEMSGLFPARDIGLISLIRQIPVQSVTVVILKSGADWESGRSPPPRSVLFI